MKRFSDRVIKSRHKGLSGKELNRGGVGILWGEVGSSRTPLDCRDREGRRRFTGPERNYSSAPVCSSYQIKCQK